MEPPTVQKNKIECKMTFRNEEPHVNKCFPRIRGDVPGAKTTADGKSRFSPHTRGCSDLADVPKPAPKVFPAYAGMFLSTESSTKNLGGFPRIRGDVPARVEGLQIDWLVFPAYAGMFLSANVAPSAFCRFPRIRGDVPDATPQDAHTGRFSPHTRGCSEVCDARYTLEVVFPAYAGMFR